MDVGGPIFHGQVEQVLDKGIHPAGLLGILGQNAHLVGDELFHRIF